jgi:hypothetical protein
MKEAEALQIIKVALNQATEKGSYNLDQAIAIGQALTFLIETHNNALAKLDKPGEDNTKSETSVG